MFLIKFDSRVHAKHAVYCLRGIFWPTCDLKSSKLTEMKFGQLELQVTFLMLT